MKLHILALLVTAVLWPGAGHTQKIDPSQVQFITPTGASSLCIGDPRTPLCAIETIIGCARQVRRDRCDVVDIEVHELRDDRIEYVIVRAGYVNKRKVARALKEDSKWEFGNYIWLSHDAYQALILRRLCSSDQDSCGVKEWETAVYTVAKNGPYWTYAHGSTFRPLNWFVD